MIDGLDVSYSSDELALSGILRGKTLTTTFEDVVLARDVCDMAARRSPSRASILQQRAIFEYTYPKGSLDEAQAAIDAAVALQPCKSTIRHTKSQVLRWRALATSSEFARRTFRSQAREELDMRGDQNDPYVFGTRARLL